MKGVRVSEGKMLLLSAVGAFALLLLNPQSFAAVVCETNVGRHDNATKEFICPILEALDTSPGLLSAAGPWGGSGGSAFYDGTASAVSAIHIRHGKAIYSLQTQYVLGGTLHWSQLHGGSDGELVTINLNYDEEYVSQIKGYHGEGVLRCQCPTVNAIEFKVVNSKSGLARSIGPFGSQIGTPFASPPGGKIVGFYGRAGTAIDQIGVYVHYAAHKLYQCDPTLSTS